MAIYRRRRDRDTWHWCRNCSNYPTGSDVVISYSKQHMVSYVMSVKQKMIGEIVENSFDVTSYCICNSFCQYKGS